MTDNELYSYLHKYFVYNADGTFTRTDRKNSDGILNRDGYLGIKIKKKRYLAHRLVWLYHNGVFPTLEIDHINRVRTDNRIENLREVTRWENVVNKEDFVNPQTGAVGIYYDTTTKGLLAKYSFHFCGKSYRFRNIEDAIRERERLRNDLRKTCEDTRRLIRAEGTKKHFRQLQLQDL